MLPSHRRRNAPSASEAQCFLFVRSAMFPLHRKRNVSSSSDAHYFLPIGSAIVPPRRKCNSHLGQRPDLPA
eukprot:6860083-Pyramimonas_sp.AAC.1